MGYINRKLHKSYEQLEDRVARAEEIQLYTENRCDALEKEIKKMKCCGNCKHCKPCVTVNETIGNMCKDYSGGSVCNNWQLKEE